MEQVLIDLAELQSLDSEKSLRLSAADYAPPGAAAPRRRSSRFLRRSLPNQFSNFSFATLFLL